MKYIINGKVFFKKNITGLQRYVIEILKELDLLIENTNIDIELLVPTKCYNIEKYKNIKIVKYKNGNSIFWEQYYLYCYAKKNNGIIINMTNTAPILKTDILFIHDINCIKNKKYFSFFKRGYYEIIFNRTIKKATELITVSQFTRDEIEKKYKIEKKKIKIITNGWEHILKIKEEKIKYPNQKEYFFSLGTIDKHKNIKWVIEIAKKNPQYNFLISGIKPSKKVFKELDIENISNVIYLGYLTDGEMKFIMRNAKALIFPSLYEGFGIPPIEKLALGGKAIVSNISPLKEIYQDTVYYINPNVFEINLDELLKTKIEKPNKILEKYSWKKSAENLLEVLKKLEDNIK